MAEIWGAAIAAGGAILGGMAQSKKAKDDRKAASKERMAATKDEALYTGILSQFEAEQERYYSQLERSDKQRGLDTFRAYNTVGNPSTNRIVVPEKPTIQGVLDAAAIEAEKSAGGKSSIFGKLDDAENKVRRHLDPIGAKISRKDPVRKALKKLF